MVVLLGDRVVDIKQCRTGYIEDISRGGAWFVKWHGQNWDWLVESRRKEIFDGELRYKRQRKKHGKYHNET